MSGQAVWMSTLHSQGEYPVRRVAPCHGVLRARITSTAQAGWKSWCVSAPGPHEKHGAHAVCTTLPRLPASHQLHEQGHIKQIGRNQQINPDPGPNGQQREEDDAETFELNPRISRHSRPVNYKKKTVSACVHPACSQPEGTRPQWSQSR